MGLRDWMFDKGVDTFKQKAVIAIIRTTLTMSGAGFLIVGKDNDGNIEQLAGALITVGTLLWSLYEKWKADQQQKQDKLVALTALGLAGISENKAKAIVSDPTIPTPPLSTHPDLVPFPIMLKSTT